MLLKMWVRKFLFSWLYVFFLAFRHVNLIIISRHLTNFNAFKFLFHKRKNYHIKLEQLTFIYRLLFLKCQVGHTGIQELTKINDSILVDCFSPSHKFPLYFAVFTIFPSIHPSTTIKPHFRRPFQ